jgi:hypothetical protein
MFEQKYWELKRIHFGRISTREKPSGDQETVGIRFWLVIVRFDRAGTSSPSGIHVWSWFILK